MTNASFMKDNEHNARCQFDGGYCLCKAIPFRYFNSIYHFVGMQWKPQPRQANNAHIHQAMAIKTNLNWVPSNE